MRGDQRAVRAAGMEGHQGAVEACLFVGAGHGFDVVRLQGGAAARVDLRGVMAADIADEFNAHGQSLSGTGSTPPPGVGSVTRLKSKGRSRVCKMPVGSNLSIKIWNYHSIYLLATRIKRRATSSAESARTARRPRDCSRSVSHRSPPPVAAQSPGPARCRRCRDCVNFLPDKTAA